MFNLFKKRKPSSNTRSYADITEQENKILQQCLPFTMTGKDRLIALIRAVDYLQQSNIPGDIIECGVWKGGSMMAVAQTLMHRNSSQRDLFLYDTFEGMPEPLAVDVSMNQSSAKELYDKIDKWCFADDNEVKTNLLSTGYPLTRMHFIKGKVEETLLVHSHKQIALLRLDTDWYESTKVELEQLFDKLAVGGVLIIDDYGHWQGARKAVDEFFRARGINMFLHRVDYTCRIGIKP